MKDDILEAEICALKYPLYNSGCLRLYAFLPLDKPAMGSGLCGLYKMKGLKAGREVLG